MPITLEKKGDSHKIDLSKNRVFQQLIVKVNLNWNQKPNQNGGFFAKLIGNDAPDLDLGCMYETVNGDKGVIQPLGGNFGSKHTAPYIFLDKDDRTGAAQEGENMTIYRPETIKRVMFFALIYQGAKDFQSVDGRMIFQISNGEKIYIKLNNPDYERPFCAAAMISNLGSQVKIIKEERYFQGHKFADDYYKFGFEWVPGSK
ncbi:tellurium resistance protein TerA [Crocosphaera chwakensis]|uniref:Tellurium resistance protein TerA n=1 Tax=Crocosphaera chwakensis CCY0110 TaxID=391612 RepID=A3IZJ8_9CHRO|nr:tellurium resistance protein TerA [Crocosphaera chwakensis]EAZ88093.1 tellurium resistance protein TerA [Crocosphaera chwakensis CCY0110]